MPPVWVVSLVVTVLKQLGFVNWAEAIAIKFGTEVIKDIGELKTYHSDDDFPHGKNGA